MKNKLFGFVVLLVSLIFILSIHAFADQDNGNQIINDVNQEEENGDSGNYSIDSPIVINETEVNTEDSSMTEDETSDAEENDESKGVIFNYEDRDYVITEISDESQLPEGFAFSTLEYEGNTVAAGENIQNGQKIVLATDNEGNTKWFLCSKLDGFVPFMRIQTNEKNIIPLPINDGMIIKGFERGSYESLNGRMDVLKNPDGFNSENPMYLVRGLNENNEDTWYWYDVNDGTLQRYFENLLPKVEEPEPEIEESSEFIEKETKHGIELEKDDGKYAIVVFDKEEGEDWKIKKEYHFDSPAIFVIIIILAVILNLAIIFTMIIVFNRIRNRNRY